MSTIYNKGTYPTMITPYKKDGSIDLETVRKYVRFYYEAGCDGIFAVCQSSEIFFLSLDERVLINRTVYDEAQKLWREQGRLMTVVSSGHVSDTVEEQAKELRAIHESGTDALILITNRLAREDEDDGVWIENAERLLSLLPSDVMLGVYECPYPYKRLLTPRVLEWCIKKGRFKLIKDTSCDSDVIRERLRILDGSGIMLFNANAQTLLTSLKDGAAGYCGVMANYHPELYVWMTKNFKDNPRRAESLGETLCMSAFTECGLPYPLSAKYHMCLRGIQTELITRKPGGGEVTGYVKECVCQMKSIAERYLEFLSKENV